MALEDGQSQRYIVSISVVKGKADEWLRCVHFSDEPPMHIVQRHNLPAAGAYIPDTAIHGERWCKHRREGPFPDAVEQQNHAQAADGRPDQAQDACIMQHIEDAGSIRFLP